MSSSAPQNEIELTRYEVYCRFEFIRTKALERGVDPNLFGQITRKVCRMPEFFQVRLARCTQLLK